MTQPLQKSGWKNRWRAYTGDRDLELAIRAALRQNGYKGGSAQILDTRLVAVQRPGWVQVYSFLIETLDEDDRRWTLYGGCRQDERKRTVIQFYQSESDRALKLGEWSRGLVTMHRRKRSNLEWLLIAGFLAVMTLAVVSSMQGT